MAKSCSSVNHGDFDFEPKMALSMLKWPVPVGSENRESRLGAVIGGVQPLGCGGLARICEYTSQGSWYP